MPGPRQHWLASAFVLFGLLCAAGLVLLATGRLQIDSELPGLLVGAVLGMLLWLGLRGR
jgi:hypothetical protein